MYNLMAAIIVAEIDRNRSSDSPVTGITSGGCLVDAILGASGLFFASHDRNKRKNRGITKDRKWEMVSYQALIGYNNSLLNQKPHCLMQWKIIASCPGSTQSFTDSWRRKWNLLTGKWFVWQELKLFKCFCIINSLILKYLTSLSRLLDGWWLYTFFKTQILQRQCKNA